MSLVKTLATVAAGALVARGVGSMVNRHSGGGMQQGGAGGGLGGMLGGMLGGGQQGSAGGGLGGMLGGAGGAAAGGGLGGMLGGILSGKGTQGGGLGGMLENLRGGGMPDTQAAPPAPSNGSLGGMLNQAFDNFGGEPEQAPSAAQEAEARLLLRAMIAAAKSDGQIDAAEREKLLGHLGESASPEEIEFVKSELAAPLDAQGLISDVPAGMERQVYLMSLMAIDLDHQNEAQYLDGLARGMNLSPEVCNAIHDKLGAPRLYT